MGKNSVLNAALWVIFPNSVTFSYTLSHYRMSCLKEMKRRRMTLLVSDDIYQYSAELRSDNINCEIDGEETIGMYSSPQVVK